MMELAVKPRTELGKKVNRLRKAGVIPAVLYGYGIPSVAVQVEARAFENVWKEAGESSLISLVMDDGARQTVLINDVARDVLRGVPIHVDLYAVRMDRPIEANIPLVFVGESEAVKALGGVLVKVAHELAVRALPKDLPHEIPVDLTLLHILGDQIFVKDIALPVGAEALVEPEQVLVLVEAPRTEEELAAMEQPAEVSLENIEVAGKKEKEEKEQEEGVETANDAEKKE